MIDKIAYDTEPYLDMKKNYKQLKEFEEESDWLKK